MGGSVSMLRAEIQAHVRVAATYPSFLEPNLYVTRYFLEICEEGEGIRPADRNNAAVLSQMSMLSENDLSTEVGLLAENERAIDVLLRIIETYRSMTPAPEFDTKKRLFARIRRPDPFPDLYEPVAEYDIARNQASLLRMALRCMRMVTVVKDARQYIYAHSACIPVFNRVVDENPLDDFVRQDVKGIFKNLYAGDESVKRIETASIAITVELMTDYDDSPAVSSSPNAAEAGRVQLAAIKRLQVLVHEAPDHVPCHAALLTADAIPAVGRALARFPETYADIYAHTCRLFVTIVSPPRLQADEEAGRPHDERLPKIIGQHGGVEGAVRLLKHCRGFFTRRPQNTTDAPPPAATAVAVKKLSAQEELDALKERMLAPGGSNQEADDTRRALVEEAPRTDWTVPDLAQQALWALDVLSVTEFNRIAMKREKLKFVIREVTLGSKLIVPRRLRLIQWAAVGYPDDDEDPL
ncbi:hypothetical protein ACHHYP_13763 [Achlya hypogyna]|uniref:Uncharacterized protein n=1 Tax=Achlya hypogyna TaxID=1202772 RepID=A0A1V9ZFP3_ACHHY|nr:hypothetical protein ACHHYP_13763 [Achlya hypogyna]